MSEEQAVVTSKVEKKLPAGQTFTLGLQHVLAMYAGAVAVPLIVGAAAGLTQSQLAILVACDLFTCGVATLIQTLGFKNFIGIKLPVVMACTFTAVGPMVGVAKMSGIQAVFGAIIVAGIMVFLLSPYFAKLIRFFPPVVTGSIIVIIGLSLIPVGINNAAGGVGSESFASPQNLLLALFVLVVILLVNKYFEGFVQSIAVLIGLLMGTVVATFMGMVDFATVSNAHWVKIVRPFMLGLPKFELGAIITMCITSLVVMVESLGCFIGMGEICERSTTEKDVVKAYRAEGIATFLGGVFNSFPYTTFFQNVGLVSLTKVTSRFVVAAAGVILVVLGCIPKFAALATIIPLPVFGGAMIIMFTMVAVSGFQMLQEVDFTDNNNMLIAACSVGIGVGISVVPGLFECAPPIIQTIFGESGIVTGSLTAIILNLFFNFKNYRKSNVEKEEAVSASE